MTGVELASLAGKAGATAAAKLATKFVQSLTLRWRVARSVKKVAAFSFPHRRYRKWLSNLKVSDLSQPVEVGGPRLSMELDRALGEVGSWNDDPERHSKALQIVEATYVSMIERANESDAGVLRDGWARARHEEVLIALVDSLDMVPRLSRDDLSITLRRTSLARRQVRLNSFGLDPAKLTSALNTLRRLTPTVLPGQVRILVGPFGSGKSERAEQWFLDRVDDFAESDIGPRPIWLHASELASHPLTATIAGHASSDELAKTGVSVVIDGLDEVDGPVAARIADQARVFIAANDRSACLLTCRPGVLSLSDDQIVADGLEHDDALLLVEEIAGTAQSTWAWNPLLVDAIRRPFFAIAAALLLADGTKPRGQADLINRLVERALSRQTSAAVAVTSSELYQLLVKLGSNTTTSGNQSDGLTFQERQRARTSTLVNQRPDGRVEFSLPIFQQWFAAQAIRDNVGLIGAALKSPQNFDRWRWAVAIAGLAASPSELDELLEQCFHADPGAGAWILARLADGHQWFRAEDSPIDAAAAPNRLLNATRTLIDSTGPLAPLVYPITHPKQPISLGVSVSGNRVSTGWLMVQSETDRVLQLPDYVHPFATPSDAWRPDRTGVVPEGDEWPWTLSKERIESSMLDVLNHHPRLGPRNGIWHIESRYRTARLITDSHSMLFAPLEAAAVLYAANELLALRDVAATTRFQFGRHVIGRSEIADLANWLSETGVETIERPVPIPDAPADRAKGGWIWDLYSDERLVEFYAEMYGNACAAYDEAISTVFSKFAWSMGSAANGQLGVIADLSFTDAGWGGSRMPGISGTKVLMDSLEDAASTSHKAAHFAKNGRAAVTVSGMRTSTDDWVKEYANERNRLGSGRLMSPFARGWSHWTSIANPVNHSRPASLMAAGWIFDDLKALKLASGTFPQLD